MKSRLKNLIVSTRADRLVRRSYGGVGSILMFHRIQPRCSLSAFGASSRGDVAPGEFSRMVVSLRRDGIDVVSLDEAMSRLASPAISRSFVCLTFDDGYRDNHEVLWPIVREHQVPVTIYVTPGFIDRTAPMWWYGLDIAVGRNSSVALRFEDGDVTVPTSTPAEKAAGFASLRQRLLAAPEESRDLAVQSLSDRYGIDFPAIADAAAMTWDMVRELADCDLVEIGAHTLTHPPLASLAPEAAFHEIHGSRVRLEHELGRPVRHFAFPYGDELTTGRREAQLAADSGFASATTTRQGALFPAHRKALHALPRFSMGIEDCPVSLRIKLSGLPVALRRPLRPIVAEPAE